MCRSSWKWICKYWWNKKIGAATHSVVLSLGNKIIKFGGDRHGFEVQNHPRIL